MKALKILIVSSEVAPFARTGGLGDVCGALPIALAQLGHDVRVVMPCYSLMPDSCIGEHLGTSKVPVGGRLLSGSLRSAKLPATNLTVYQIERKGYFGRKNLYGTNGKEYKDNLDRFSFFCHAVLAMIPKTGWKPDIVHCHDWHTALVPALIKTRFSKDQFWGGRADVFTIHNLAYQGCFPKEDLIKTGLPVGLFTMDCLEFYGKLNLMKGAIAFSSKINTVSPQYSKEIMTPEMGHGLDGFLSTRESDLSGILNGVDYEVWHPSRDSALKANYDVDNLDGKAVCKEDLQRHLGLPVKRGVPIIGLVSRIDWQKGFDLIIDSFDELVKLDMQLVILGSGDPKLERMCKKYARLYPDRISVSLKFDHELSHKIEGGSDFFLMPSRFEPCGLSQLYSLAYGTIPIVRATGGLADTVSDVDEDSIMWKEATGIVFREATPGALIKGIVRALDIYKNRALMMQIQRTGMKMDFSWDRSARKYVQLYHQAIAAP